MAKYKGLTISKARSAAMRGNKNAAGPHPNHPKRAPEIVEVREMQAVELMLAGADYSEVARGIGLTASGARQLVLRVMNRWKDEHEEKIGLLREMEAKRMDRLYMALYAQATDTKNPNLQASAQAVRIAERKAKLLGLDVPQQFEVSPGVGGPVVVREVIIERPPKDE